MITCLIVPILHVSIYLTMYFLPIAIFKIGCSIIIYFPKNIIFVWDEKTNIF